ncbi:TPR domain protein [Cystobacter fuscus DSM 2262]|uniref:TPR domain protein n=1 Tax=Cystobacter fuscus (strain ATCC 25194 / DSM 2262 / NBRC 100088 / M29) TaxID=1242864 RepID=S9Q9B2_CYSF2|nr:hypothetical protein [Cystobacter fuscus]EPX57939.1 TPR domain protein [Cystobacter fuscus DSM 2262]
MGFRTVALVLVLALPLPTLAARESIRNHLLVIQQLLGTTQYERALDQLQVARQERHGTDEDVTLSLYEGILLYELRRKDEAKAAFRRGFLLRPKAELPVPVSPKIQADVDAVRQQVEAELKAMPNPPAQPEDLKAESTATPSEKTPSGLRRHALIPALAGGALVVAGGVSLGISRAQANILRDDDPRIVSRADAELVGRRGQNWQTAGFSLLGVGAAGLLTAAGMYLLGAPDDAAPSIGVGTNGTSAFLYGRWP